MTCLMIIYFASIPPGAASEPVCWQEPGELDIAIRWAFQSPQGSAESLRHIRCLLRQAHSAVVGLSPKHRNLKVLNLSTCLSLTCHLVPNKLQPHFAPDSYSTCAPIPFPVALNKAKKRFLGLTMVSRTPTKPKREGGQIHRCPLLANSPPAKV